MSVTIEKIELENYRQYKSMSIEFKKGIDNNLHVLKAQNGTGKTTFLNAITWCLYGEEKYITDSEKALSLPNDKVVESTEENGTVKVSARMTLLDSDTNQMITIIRDSYFRVNFNIVSQNKKAFKEQSKFYIAITNLKDVTKNSVIIDDPEECVLFVDTYFNRTIFDYYFFDGENLKNYFSKQKSETIQNAIFNISQVTLLENTKNRTNSIGVAKYRKYSRLKPGETNYYEEQVKLTEEIEARSKKNRELESNILNYAELKSNADRILNNYTPIKTSLQNKARLTIDLEKKDEEAKELRNDQYEFIQNYMILLHFYPRIKKVYEMICEKEKNNELPPNINKREIQDIIDKHLSNCPYCNSKLDDDAIKYLQKLLHDTSVSTGTSHQLMKIKSSLELMIDDANKFEDKKEKLLKREKNLLEERKQIEEQLNQIHSYLSHYSTDDLEKNIAQAEKDSHYYEQKINEARILVSQNNAFNKTDNIRLNEIEKLLQKEEEKEKDKSNLEKQVVIYRKITSSLESIKSKIMLLVKNEIEKNTWKMFDAMIWKKYTFKSLSINNDYHISVLNMNNKEMIGSLSATEYMALAYSFTLAIHEASGKNCPLVVDSPLGRVSDENRGKMANELLKVAKDKQIIMLFTPDEYSSDVQKVYENNVASIRTLKLSEDESEVEGGIM